MLIDIQIIKQRFPIEQGNDTFDMIGDCHGENHTVLS